MKHPRIAAPLVASMMMLGGCSGSDPAAPGPKRLELLTWWVQPTELAAIDALVALHEEQHPNVDVAILSSNTRATMVSDIESRLAAGNPPAAFQENLGGRARGWAEYAQPLNEHSDWSDAFPRSVLDLVTAGDRLIGVPVAITRGNNAYYNQKVLSALDMSVPEGNEGLLEWLEELGEAGYSHPLCAGDFDNWVSALILFADIVPAHAGAAFSESYWSGTLSADAPEFVAALEFAASIVGYFGPDTTKFDMAAGVERLMVERPPETQCVMTPMGDWGGAILAAKFQAGTDFVQSAWPGTEGSFVLAGDAFISTADQAEAYDFFDTVASREGQIAFNAKKGSLPARTVDAADWGSFGELTQQNLSEFASQTVTPAFYSTAAGDFPWDALYERTHDFFLTADALPIVAFMKENYGKLKP